MKTTLIRSLAFASLLLVSGVVSANNQPAPSGKTVSFTIPGPVVETGRIMKHSAEQAYDYIKSALSTPKEGQAPKEGFYEGWKNYFTTVYNGGYNLENAQTHPEAFMVGGALVGAAALYAAYKLYRAIYPADKYK
jgi:hypothetical protein